MYEVTGGQETAASKLNVDYAGLARSAGFYCVEMFDDLELWKDNCEAFFQSAGPRFAWLKVGPAPEEALSENPIPADERIRGLQKALEAVE